MHKHIAAWQRRKEGLVKEGAGRSWSVFSWKGQNREKLPAWLLGLLKTPIRKHLEERPPEYTRHYSEDKTQRMEWWPLDAKNTETAKCFCVQEKRKKTSNNIVIKKHVNLPQNDIRCMKTRQSLQSFQCPGLKSTLSRPKQGFNCQGQLMRATSAPSNLQGQRQSVINCCVHKCKWVHWGSRRRGGGKGLSGQYSSGEQSAREGNDLEDSTQICCSVKHEEAECEGRLVEMEEVVVRIGRKNNGNNCGGNKYQPFYSSCLFSIRPLQTYGLSHHQNKKKNTISHCSWVLLCGKMFLSFFFFHAHILFYRILNHDVNIYYFISPQFCKFFLTFQFTSLSLKISFSAWKK